MVAITVASCLFVGSVLGESMGAPAVEREKNVWFVIAGDRHRTVWWNEMWFVIMEGQHCPANRKKLWFGATGA